VYIDAVNRFPSIWIDVAGCFPCIALLFTLLGFCWKKKKNKGYMGGVHLVLSIWCMYCNYMGHSFLCFGLGQSGYGLTEVGLKVGPTLVFKKNWMQGGKGLEL